MKKLLLVGINARYTHSNLALRYLRNFVIDLDYKIKLLEFSINQNFLEILELIALEEPETIALSVYIWNTDVIKSLLSEIKKILPEIKIVLGGPEVSYDAEDWLEQFPQIDYIICGFGEAGFKYLLENELNVKNTIIRLKNPLFSDIPFPYLPSDFPEIKNKYIYYESSRGCSFKCSYCLSSRLDQVLEFRDIEVVKSELNFLIEQQPRIIKFIDRTFNIRKKHSREIWKFLIDLNPKVKFHFEIHPELLEEEDLEIFKTVPRNLFQFEIGLQSTNPATLEAIHRNNLSTKATNLVRKLIALGNIHIHVDLIAGLPHENIFAFKQSFNDIFNLHADQFQLGFLKVLKGTEMDENKTKFGILSSDKNPYLILQNKWLLFDELNGIHRIEILLNTFSNSNKFSMTLKYLISEFNSPFDFFSNFLEFLNTRNYDLRIKNWEKNANQLIQFTNSLFPKKKKLFSDCLRWDWCLQAKAHYYPEFLRSELNFQAKKLGTKYLNKHKAKLEKSEITISDLKQTIYFIPESIKFKKENLPNSDVVAFIKGKPIFNS